MTDITAYSDDAHGHGQQLIPQSIVLSTIMNTAISLLHLIDEGKVGKKHQVYMRSCMCLIRVRSECASLFRAKVTYTVYFSIFDANFLCKVQPVRFAAMMRVHKVPVNSSIASY